MGFEPKTQMAEVFFDTCAILEALFHVFDDIGGIHVIEMPDQIQPDQLLLFVLVPWVVWRTFGGLLTARSFSICGHCDF